MGRAISGPAVPSGKHFLEKLTMAQLDQDQARLRGLLQNQPPLEGTGRCAGRFDHAKTLLFPTGCLHAVRDACIDACFDVQLYLRRRLAL